VGVNRIAGITAETMVVGVDWRRCRLQNVAAPRNLCDRVPKFGVVEFNTEA
jgi:hypothetical protein